MNLHDQIPVLILHILEADVSKDAGVVDEDVYPSVVVNRGLDDALAVHDIVVVGDGLAAGFPDLVND